MAFPTDAHFPYYPYMYPPAPFAIGNPHVYAEHPITSGSGKRERLGNELDRKDSRDSECKTRERSDR